MQVFVVFGISGQETEGLYAYDRTVMAVVEYAACPLGYDSLPLLIPESSSMRSNLHHREVTTSVQFDEHRAWKNRYICSRSRHDEALGSAHRP